MYYPPDIVLVRGEGRLSQLIRIFTRKVGESKTIINHVGLISIARDQPTASMIEALWTVKEHRMQAAYGPPCRDKVAIARPKNLTPDEKRIIIGSAREYLGRPYGVMKIATHWLDYWIGDRFVFRRLTQSEYFPICSFVVAQAYAAAGKDFGVKPGKATPDDIWDFCLGNPDKFKMVRPLKSL
jgi:hypothetical protein